MLNNNIEKSYTVLPIINFTNEQRAKSKHNTVLKRNV